MKKYSFLNLQKIVFSLSFLTLFTVFFAPGHSFSQTCNECNSDCNYCDKAYSSCLNPCKTQYSSCNNSSACQNNPGCKENCSFQFSSCTSACSNNATSCCGGWSTSANSMGYIGCSLTLNAVNGYHTLGGVELWPPEQTNYGGGALDNWVMQARYGDREGGTSFWAAFNHMLKLYPNPRIIWWHLCPSGEATSVTYDDVVFVLNKIRSMAPGAQIYVSSLPVYPLDGRHCSTNQSPVADHIMTLVNELVLNKEARQGPILDPLTTSEVMSDGCHGNEAGRKIWGQDLINVFGY